MKTTNALAVTLSVLGAACAADSAPIAEEQHRASQAAALERSVIAPNVRTIIDANLLLASTPKVDFGSVAVGSSSGAAVDLKNVGASTVTIERIDVIPPDPYHNPPGFHNPPADSIGAWVGDFMAYALLPAVRPGESTSLRIGFVPTAVGIESSTVVVTYADGSGTVHDVRITVEGTGASR